MKQIWFIPVTIEEINRWSSHRLMDNLGIEFTAIGDDYLQAKMPVDERTIQPLGCLHGGASCVLAETVGSVAAHFCVDPKLKFCVGLEINVNHVKSMRSGWVSAIARPLHLGQSTQIWDIQIRIENPGLKAWDCISRGGDSNPSPPVFLKDPALKGGVSSVEDEQQTLIAVSRLTIAVLNKKNTGSNSFR